MAEDFTTSDSVKISAPVRFWLGEISAAWNREKDYRKEGTRILEIYNGAKKGTTPFNILYSNTETMLPALYNNQPRPEVQRRFKDDDPLGKATSQVGERSLTYLIDTNSDEYSPFDSVMTDAVLDALLPGRGATRVKYDAETPQGEQGSYLKSESICYESIKWNRWIFGYARKWCHVPWVALEHDVSKTEATELFGAEVANKLKYTAENTQEDKDAETPKDTLSEEEDRKTCKIYEIWDKAGGRKVKFIAESYKEDYLKVDDDPLELTGFYPIPEPIRFLRKSNDLVPTALYLLYENQATELNRITTRINRIVEAIKVRGAYDSTITELADLLKKDDNALVPATNVAALQDGDGLNKAIWLMPVEKLVTVVQQLYIAREACKKVIYEITGISDILRGSSQASETLGAQEIKQQWATLRLKRLQKEVARYARDLMRLTIEIAGKHFSIETFKAMTGLPYPTEAQKKEVAGRIARAQAMGQQPDPMALQVMQSPTWEQIAGELRNDVQRQYRIDIETNSTVDLEATEDQKDIAELMTAMGQFLSGVTPLVEAGSMPFGAAQAMLLTITRRFRFGDEVEDQIKQMGPPKPKDDGKAAADQAKLQLEQQKAQHDSALAVAEQKRQDQEVAHAQQLEIMKFKYEQQMDSEKEARLQEREMAKISANRDLELAKLSSQRATEERKMMIQQETELKKAALVSATQIQVAEISANASRDTAETSARASKETAELSAAPAKEEASENSAVMNKLVEMQGKLLEAISAPKDIERDKSGRALTLVPRVKAMKDSK